MNANTLATSATSATSALPAALIDPERLLMKAIEANVPVETMERLLAMRGQLKAEAAREAYFQALTAFQAACPQIPRSRIAKVKTKSGAEYQYLYAPLEVIGQTIAPYLEKYGLSYRFDTAFEASPPAQVVTCTVHHVGGHCETSTFRCPIDEKAGMNEMQKSGSSQTYGKRFALQNALGLLTCDTDDDANSTGERPSDQTQDAPRYREPEPTGPRRITSAQLKLLKRRIEQLNLDEGRVTAWCAAKWNVGVLDELSEPQFHQLINHKIKQFAEQAKAPIAPAGDAPAPAAPVPPAERLLSLEQAAALISRCQTLGVDPQALVAALNCGALDQLPRARYAEADRTLVQLAGGDPDTEAGPILRHRAR